MLRQPTGSIVTEALLKQYEYDAIETCAGDGSCALACPVGINTGMLIGRTLQSLFMLQSKAEEGIGALDSQLSARVNTMVLDRSVMNGEFVGDLLARLTCRVRNCLS